MFKNQRTKFYISSLHKKRFIQCPPKKLPLSPLSHELEMITAWDVDQVIVVAHGPETAGLGNALGV